MSGRRPSDDGSSRILQRRHELESRYDQLHSSILRTAWDIREDQYKRELDTPAFPPISEAHAKELIEYLDVTGTDWVDFGDNVLETLAYAEVDYSLRITRDPESDFGIRADWRFWECIE